MKSPYGSLLRVLVTMACVVCAGGSACAARGGKDSPKSRLEVALGSAQTVFFVEQDGQVVGTAAPDPWVYKMYGAMYSAIQGINRYQMLASAAGADLIVCDTRAGLNILDGKTLELVGTLYVSPFDLTAKKYTGDLVKQITRLAGSSKAINPVVPQAVPQQPSAAERRDPPPASSLSVRLSAARSVYISERDRFPAPKKEAYAAGQMAAMLRDDLTAWGRDQALPTTAGADLIVTTSTNNGCVATGTTTTERVGLTKTDVPDIRCDDKPSVGLGFLDARTLQVLGYVWVDQPEMNTKAGQG